LARPLAVLVVDDNRDAAESLALVIRHASYKVQTAYSAGEAATHMQAGFSPDAILMDIGLPDLDGFAVGKELCRGLPKRPLLAAVTGHSDLDRRAREEGFQVCFVKPVDPGLILSLLEGYAARLHRGENDSGSPAEGN
jgi:DNA-binding response OmpR family regulator